MENQSSRILLKPLKAADESQLISLIDSLSNITKCDLNIFNQIRDFFFQLSNSDFDKLTQKYASKFFIILVTLYKVPNAQFKDSEQKISRYKSAFLSLLGFINFRLLNSKTTKELLDILVKQINESSYEDLVHILRIIRYSFNSRDPEFLKILPKIMAEINPGIRNRLINIIKDYESITMQTLTPAISLLTMLSNPIQLLMPVLPTLEKILKHEYQNRVPLQNLISLFALQFKILTLLSPTNTNFPIVPTLIRILLKTPPSISSIIENSAEILINYIQKDPERRMEPMVHYFPQLLNFKLLTSENFRPYSFIIQFSFEQLQKLQKVNEDLLLKFSKYITSILHFRKATFTQCASCFNNIYNVIALPVSQTQFRNSLLSLYIFSFDVGFMEIEQQIVRMMDMMSSQRELLCAFNALLIVGEYYYRLLKFLIRTVKIVNQCEFLKGKPFLVHISSPLPKIEFQQLVELLVRSLIILMKYREALQQSIQMVRFIEQSKSSQDHYKLCNQNLKAVRTYDRARKFHFNSAQEMISCISAIPSFFAQIVWDRFFEKFFSSTDNFGLDTCTFRVVIADVRVFQTFFNSITNFICKKLKSGNQLTNFLKSMQTIFEKLSVKPSYPPKAIENIEKIFNEANKVISACKEMMSDPQYCSEILAFIRYFSSFLNFVSNSNKYTSQLINDNFISFVIKNVSQVPFAQKAILNFISYAANKKTEILKNSNVINFLILSLSSDFNQSLFLLHASKKQDKVKFFQHHLMPTMYVTLIKLLDKATNETRKIIVKFLKKIPANLVKTMDSVPDTLMNNHSILLKRGDKSVIFDCDSLIASIRMSLSSNLADSFLWDFLTKIIQSFTEIKNWNTDQHKFFFQILILFIHFYQKDPKEVEEHFIKIFQINHILMKCHFLIALYSEMIEPSTNLINSIFKDIQDKESFKLFITNIITIIKITDYSTKIVLSRICHSIINNLPLEIIDEISFSILVHHTVIDSYSTEWIVEQHCDLITSFNELNYLSEDSLQLIKFCRERLTGNSISILPILNLIKLSTSLLPILVAVEMISKNENIEEIFQFLDEFISNDVACYEYGNSRIIGPLSRAFPVILDKYYEKIAQIIKESTENISSMNNRKHQGLFLVILLPVLNSNKFSGIVDFDSILSICNQFLTCQSPLLKSQAQQVYRALYQYGSEQIKMKIQTQFEQLTKLNNTKSNFLKWIPLIDVAFTYFPIFTNKVLSISLNDLDLIKQGISLNSHQNSNPDDFFKTISSNLSFLSSGIVVQYLISQNLFFQTAKQIILVYNQLTYFRDHEHIIKFFEQSRNEFPKFVNQTLDDESVMNFFALNIDQQKLKDLFNQYLADIKITDENIKKNPIISLIALKTDMNQYLIQSIINVSHQMIDAYDKYPMSFKSIILKEIVIWFSRYRAEDFFYMSFHAFEVNSPLLTALFSQSAPVDVNLEYFLNLKYLDKDEINFAFLEAFIFPLLQKNQRWLDTIVDFVHDKFSVSVFLQFINLLYNTRILTTKVKYDAFEIYKQCQTDEMQLQAILFWSYSGSSHFLEMFSIFASFFHIHLASEVRTVADDLKIPSEYYGNNELCTIFLNLVRLFSRNPTVLITVLTIYIKNREAFRKIDKQIWEYVQEQMMCLVNPKKNMIQNYKMQFIYLIKILPTSGNLSNNENALAHRIIDFANGMMTFTKEEEKNKYDIMLKYRGCILKGLISLGKSFGPQCEFVSQLYQTVIDLYPRTLQPNPLPNEIALFDLLMHSLPELVEAMCQYNDFPLFDKFIDFIIENHKSMDTIWTASFLCLSFLSDSKYYHDKVNEAFQRTQLSNEFINQAFPILWKNPPSEGFRISKLVPAVIKFCRFYNPEKPVDMLLSDSMLTNIFEYPADSSLFVILKACQDCIRANQDPGNRIFFSRVLVRALSTNRKDPFLEKKIIQTLEDPNVLSFFSSKQNTLTKEVFDTFSDQTKLTFGAYFLDKYEDELLDILKKNDYKTINKLSLIKHIPIAVCLSSFFEGVKPTEITKLVMNLSSIASASLQKQITEPFTSNNLLQIKIKLSLNSIENIPHYNINSLSNWSLPETLPTDPPSVYEALGLTELAQKSLPSSLNEIDPTKLHSILENNPKIPYRMCDDRHLENLYICLCSEGLTVKHIADELTQIIERANFFVTAESFPSLIIIQQSKYFIAALKPNASRPASSGSNKNSGDNGSSSNSSIPNLSMKLFSYLLSPSFAPQLHAAYTDCREMMMEILRKSGSSNSNFIRLSQIYDEYEKKHIKNAKKSREYHFIEHYENNLQALVLYLDFQKVLNADEATLGLAKENILKGLKLHRSSDVFLAASYALFDKIKDDFVKLYNDEYRIPFKWSQLFAEIGAPELSSIVHTGFQCIFISRQKIIYNANARNILAFLQDLQSTVKSPALQKIKKRYEMESRIAEMIRTENKDSKRRVIFKDDQLFKVETIEPSKSENSEESEDVIKRAENLLIEADMNEVNDHQKISIYVSSFSFNPIPAIFCDFNDSQIVSVSLFLESQTSMKCSIKSLLTNGFLIQYSLVPFRPMEARLGTFYDVITSSFFQRSPSKYSRSQKILSIPSMPVSDGFYIMQTTAESLARESQLSSLLSVYRELHKRVEEGGDDQNEEKIECDEFKGDSKFECTFNYSTQKDFCSWFWHFATNFAAISIIQLINNYAVLNPYQLVLDEKKASISLISEKVEKLNDGDDSLCLLRFCGKVKKMFDAPMINGPFKYGLMSAADSFSFYRDKFRFFSRSILKKSDTQIDKEFERLTKFSALDRNVNEIQSDLDSLIQSSSGCNFVFAIPWI